MHWFAYVDRLPQGRMTEEIYKAKMKECRSRDHYLYFASSKFVLLEMNFEEAREKFAYLIGHFALNPRLTWTRFKISVERL